MLSFALPAPTAGTQAGGTTMCRLAQRNMVAETAQLPNRADWDSNCVPYEAFLGPHPAVGLARSTAQKNSSGDGPSAPQALRQLQQREQQQAAGASPVAALSLPLPLPLPLRQQAEVPERQGQHHRSLKLWPQPGSSFQVEGAARQLHAAHWLGGACWFGFLTPAQLRVLPHHFLPLTFLASEGALPDSVPLDLPFAMVSTGTTFCPAKSTLCCNWAAQGQGMEAQGRARGTGTS